MHICLVSPKVGQRARTGHRTRFGTQVVRKSRTVLHVVASSARKIRPGCQALLLT
jgi:hypothetical protein